MRRPVIPAALRSKAPLNADAEASADLLPQHGRRSAAATDLLEDSLLVEEVVELDLELEPVAREVFVDDAKRIERLLESVLIAAGAGIEDALAERVVVQIRAVPAVRGVIAERRVRDPFRMSGEPARPVREIGREPRTERELGIADRQVPREEHTERQRLQAFELDAVDLARLGVRKAEHDVVVRSGGSDLLYRRVDVLMKERDREVVAALVVELGADLEVGDRRRLEQRIPLHAHLELRVDIDDSGDLAQIGPNDRLAVADPNLIVGRAEQPGAVEGERERREYVVLVDRESTLGIVDIILQVSDPSSCVVEQIDRQNRLLVLLGARANHQPPAIELH